MPWPYTNKKASENVVCWTCEHFQRYDDTPGTTNCQGECRKGPPAVTEASVKNFTTTITGEVEAFFPFLPFANTTWCSGYQRSLEASIPSVVQGRSNCAAQDWDDFHTPFDQYSTDPPFARKKDILESCWYCEHFQNEIDPPSDFCYGYCMLRPPWDYDNENYDFGAGVSRVGIAHTPPLIRYAAWIWCSKWERARAAVSAPPQSGGVPCKGGLG